MTHSLPFVTCPWKLMRGPGHSVSRGGAPSGVMGSGILPSHRHLWPKDTPRKHGEFLVVSWDLMGFCGMDTTHWLVVEFQPLWKIWGRQFGWWYSQLNGKIKTFQTTDQRMIGSHLPSFTLVFILDIGFDNGLTWSYVTLCARVALAAFDASALGSRHWLPILQRSKYVGFKLCAFWSFSIRVHPLANCMNKSMGWYFFGWKLLFSLGNLYDLMSMFVYFYIYRFRQVEKPWWFFSPLHRLQSLLAWPSFIAILVSAMNSETCDDGQVTPRSCWVRAVR